MVGSKAPNFELQTPLGETVSLLDFSGEFLILETGSISCPLFQGRRQSMNQLYLDYPNISFAILYVREAHPGNKLPAHKTIDNKKAYANYLQIDFGESRTILVDDISGSAHLAYGGYPNAVFIIDKNHKIVFFSDWNNPSSTRSALNNLIKGIQPTANSYFFPVNPIMAIKILNRSGLRAIIDFFISLPKLIWKNFIKRNILLLLKKVP